MLIVRSTLSCLAVITVASLSVAGCSSSATSKSSAQSQGTLTIASDSQPISLDPSLIAPEQTSPYTDPVYDRLINQSTDGSLTPGLATKWAYTGPLTFQITLRQGIKFNNGEPFTAAAVVANFTRLNTAPASGGTTASDLRRVSSVVAVNDHTVEFNLKSPDPSLAQIFSLPDGIIVSPKGLSDTRKLAGEPSGVGPYNMNLKLTVPNHKYVYDKNPNYWNASAFPYQRIVTLEILDNNARLNAIRSGQADIAMGTLADVEAAKAAGLNVNVGDSDQHDVVIMDHQGAVDKPMADVRVRQALSYAIDRSAFVKAVQFGVGSPNSEFLSSSSQVGYISSLNSYYGYDPTKAKKLLADAGYPNGFTFTDLTEPFLSQESEALAGFFSAIGVTMKINVRTNDMVPQIKSKKFSSFQDTGTPSPSSANVGNFLGGGILDVFEQNGTPELRSLYTQAMAATAPAQQQELFGKVNTYLTLNAWKISLSTSGTPVFYRKGLAVAKYASQSEPHLIGIRPTK